MKKNLFSTMLALLTIVAMLVSVGCKNYDDDISDINKKISDLSSTTATLQSSVSSLQSAVSTAQSAATAAQTAADNAQKAADKAQSAADEAAKAAQTADAAAKAAQGTADEAVKAAAAAQATADAATLAAAAADEKAVAAQAQADAALAVANAAATKAEFDAFKALVAEADSVLTGKVEANAVQIASLEAALNSAATRIENLENNYSALKVVVESQGTQIDQMASEMATAFAAISTKMGTDSTSFAESIKKYAEDFATYKEDAKAKHEEIEKNLESVKTSLSETKTALEAADANLQKQIDDLVAADKDLMDQVAKERLRVDTLSSKVSNLEAHDKVLDQAVNDNLNSILQNSFAISANAESIKDLKEADSLMKIEFKKYVDQAIKELEGKDNELANSIKALETTVSNLDTKVQGQISDLTTRLEALENDCAIAVKKSVDSVRTEYKAAIAEKETSLKAYTDAAVEAAKKELAKADTLLDEKINLLTDRVAALEAVVGNIPGSVTGLKADVQALQEKVGKLETAVEALQGQIQSVTFIPQRKDGANEIDFFNLDPTVAGASGYYALRGLSAMYFQIKPAAAAAQLTKDNVDVVTTKVTKAGAALESASVYDVVDKGDGKIKVIVRYEFTTDKFANMLKCAREMATSLVVRNGVNDVESGYIQNIVAGDDGIGQEGSKAGEITWGLTKDYVSVLPWDETFEYKIPWNTTPEASKTTFLGDYHFGFTFTNIEEYIKNPDHKYMSIDELRELSDLVFEEVHKAEYLKDVKQNVIYYYSDDPDYSVKDSIPVTYTGAGEWKSFSESLPTAQFARALTSRGAEYSWSATMKQYYSIKCGSLLFPTDGNGECIPVKYSVSYATGSDFSVESIQHNWKYADIAAANPNPDYNDDVLRPKFEYYKKANTSAVEGYTGNLTDYFSTDSLENNTYLYEMTDDGWAKVNGDTQDANEYATVGVTPAGKGHEKDELGITIFDNCYDWSKKYKVVTTHICELDQKEYTLTAEFETTEQPGVKQSDDKSLAWQYGVHSLWEEDEFVAEYEFPDAATIKYNASGMYDKTDALAKIYEKYSMSKYFDSYAEFTQAVKDAFKVANDNQSAASLKITATLDTLDRTGSEYFYANIAEGSSAGRAGYSNYYYTVGKQIAITSTKTNPYTYALYGLVDPLTITQFAHEYRQIVSVPTWFGVRFVTVRNMKFSIEDTYTLKPNDIYVNSEGVAEFKGERGNGSNASWTYPDRDLKGFYTVPGVSTAVDASKIYAVIKYENILAANGYGKTVTEASPVYEYGANKNIYVRHTYPYINESNVITFNNTSITLTEGQSPVPEQISCKPNAIKDVWVKVSGTLMLPGGGSLPLASKKFKINVLAPVAENTGFTQTYTPEIKFADGTTVNVLNKVSSAKWSDAIRGMMSIVDNGGYTIMSADTATVGGVLQYVCNNNIHGYFDATFTNVSAASKGTLIPDEGLVYDVANATVDDVPYKDETTCVEKITLDENVNYGKLSVEFKHAELQKSSVVISIPVYFNHAFFDTNWTYTGSTATYYYSPFDVKLYFKIKVVK